MGIFDFLKPKSTSAAEARKRLQVLIATGPRGKGTPDYLPALRQDILAVLQKHVPGFDPEAVNVDLHKDGDEDVLDITVALPDNVKPASA